MERASGSDAWNYAKSAAPAPILVHLRVPNALCGGAHTHTRLTSLSYRLSDNDDFNE